MHIYLIYKVYVLCTYILEYSCIPDIGIYQLITKYNINIHVIIIAGLSKESHSKIDFSSLSQLLALPNPSLSHAKVEAISINHTRRWDLLSFQLLWNELWALAFTPFNLLSLNQTWICINPVTVPVLFSGFQHLLLLTTGTMESYGIGKLFTPSPVPAVYVSRVSCHSWAEREPLLGGLAWVSATLSLLPWWQYAWYYATRQNQAFKFGCADCSRPCITQGFWGQRMAVELWPKSRLGPRGSQARGGLSAADAERICRRSRCETSRRVWETQ